MHQATPIDYIRLTTAALWLILVIVWIVNASRTKRTIQSQAGFAQVFYIVLPIVGAALIFVPKTGIPWLDRPLFPVTAPSALACFFVVLIGVAFTLWARFVLGRNWSNDVAVKEDHTLMRTGPYRIARHPIYSGILLGMLGSAFQHGELRCFIGVFFLFLAYWLKSLAEERFMVQTFGDQYVQYRRKVKALIPFIF